MSWVLILASDTTGRFPAVIGGYPDRAAAEAAGKLAIWPIKGPGDFDMANPCYQRFSVIPGAAVSEPLGCTHAMAVRDPEAKGDYQKIGLIIATHTEGGS